MCKAKKAKRVLESDTIKEQGRILLEDVCGLFSKEPVELLDLIEDAKNCPQNIRDGLFFESFEAYLLNLNKYKSDRRECVEDNLHKLSIVLAEASPNEEAGYEGDLNKLREYAKRIVKTIEDCATEMKAVFFANISRACANRLIDTNKFFKLSQCIRMLTEEDLLFLRNNVKENIFIEDSDYIDDFTGLGLMYEAEEGFTYSKRAFELLKYGLNYEGNVEIPTSFPDRKNPMIVTDKEIKDTQEDVKGTRKKLTWNSLEDASNHLK